MNIVQLHERVRFWIDSVATTRFDSLDIDNGLNSAINDKVLETYDQNRPMNKSDSFQRTQRCRDILGPIVAFANKSTPEFGLVVGTNTITISSNSDYQYLLSLGIKIGTDIYDCSPLTYDRKTVISKNPFRRPRMTPTVRMYYNEYAGNIVIIHLYSGNLTDFELYYLKTPIIINYGVEYDNTHDFVENDIIIAVEQTVYNATIYPVGSKITIDAIHPKITSGLVVFGYTETELRSSIHEEIARRAAINCLMTAGQVDKAKILREEIVAS